VLALDAVDEPPTAMHSVGEEHETANNPMVIPFKRPTGGDWDHVVPFHTSAIAWFGPK
jgi:hypothetical protein